jgi:hypothetical protein
MTNPFDSDPDPSLGHPADTPEPSGEALPATDTDPSSPEDVTATLAELEHKLLELERELSAIDTADTSVPAEQADPVQPAVEDAESTSETEQETAAAQPAESAPKLIDESLLGDQQLASTPETAPVDEPQLANDTEPVHFVDEALEPEPLVAETEPPAVASEPASSTVIAELEGFRVRLQELSEDYGELLDKLTTVMAESEASDQSEARELDLPEHLASRAEPPASADIPESVSVEDGPPAVSEEPPAAEPAFVEDSPIFEPSPATFGQPAYFESAQSTGEDTPEVSFHPPPNLHGTQAGPDDEASPAQAPVDVEPEEITEQPSQDPVREPSPEDEAIFVDHVEIGVGPFYDIESLSAFEREVARLPNVSETAVRRFEASHAVIDLHLATPTALVSELRHVVSTPFHVRQLAAGRVALTFDES